MENFNLDLNNIIDASELFSDDAQEQGNLTDDPTEEGRESEQEEIIIPAEGFSASEFADPESVGGENANENNGGDTTPPAAGSSPKNTYSSIASAFKIDGVPLFSEADDKTIEGLQNSDDFEEFLKSRLREIVDSKYDEEQKRIKDALTYGMEPTDVQIFENSIKNLNSIREEDITAETEDGEELRRNLILTDLTTVRGYSEDKAKKKLEQIFSAGTDIEDAQDALTACKEFYQSKYKTAFEEQKKAYDKAVAKNKETADKLKNDILKNDKAFGDVKVDGTTRQKIFEAINKPVGKDTNGNPITAIQKYADENPIDFRKNLAYFYVITDGFKSLDKVKDAVKNDVNKKQISALEQALNSTARNDDGSLRYFSPGGFGDTMPQGWQIELN